MRAAGTPVRVVDVGCCGRTMMSTGMLVILAIGASYLALTLHTNFNDTMKEGVLPFLIGDLLKAAVVAGVATTILPKENRQGNRQ